MIQDQTVRDVVLVGYGEVGRAFGPRIEQSGVNLLRADPACPGVRDGRNILKAIPQELPEGCLVLAAVPSAAALAVARDIASRSVRIDLIDLSSSPRSLMRDCAALFAGRPGRFMDAAIMGSVNMSGADAPITISGPDAKSWARTLTSFGFTVAALPNSQAGDASGLKLLRSLMTKGLEALAVECFSAAREMGLEAEIRENLQEIGERSFPAVLDAMVRTHVVHAPRRRHEVAAAIAQAEALGLHVPLAHAVLDAYSRTEARLQSGAFEEVPPLNEAVAWLAEGLR